MKFDIFLSICQNEVNGRMPSERVMFENFFSQVTLADELNFGTAWVAETHLSCQVQKQNPFAVIPHFKGEIGLNTDILQLAHLVFAQTKKIKMGSAIRNILCNGGPIAHAEAVRTFLTLHAFQPSADRSLELGFASGRFPFSNRPYGIVARNSLELKAWPVLSGRLFLQATEIFLRLLKGEVIATSDVSPIELRPEHFSDPQIWQEIMDIHRQESVGQRTETGLRLPSYWQFDKVGVIPFETTLDALNLTIGAHWQEAHEVANRYLPCGVFNLSITPPAVIERTHEAMKSIYHSSGGSWHRGLMPRTVLVFLSDEAHLSREQNTLRAREKAESAQKAYWTALQGTIDPAKLAQAVDNSLVGHPEDVVRQMKERFHTEDRLMLWFDFNNHDNSDVCQSMKIFMEQVAPALS